jgi:hypothetical protein
MLATAEGSSTNNNSHGQVLEAVLNCMVDRMGADDVDLLAAHPLAARAQVRVSAYKFGLGNLSCKLARLKLCLNSLLE